ncbi:histidine phosphatase family protein [Agromyces sp. H3Y2-19a]|uniref:histidine phosphatase family protein n=1 Tax=Agromyces chromiiresistens TaxID=3030835 RepID=UPI0023B8901E|nr:histidine phosphatase family protein [Agromyces chromiiresistens]MDF0513204.1 histidine phosphatase family protein [Agromyces chromiiresistens]
MTDASTSAAPVTIALVRHGETDWNVQRRIQGRTDIPLNDTGRRQAVDTGVALAASDSDWDAVYASPLSRASETAELIAAELGAPVLGHLEALAERGYGVLEGLDHAGRAAVEAQAATIEGLETRSSVIERSSAALAEIAAAHPGGRVVVVSHGGVIHSLILHLSGWTLPSAGYTVTNGSVHLVTAAAGEFELAEPDLLTGTGG